LFINICLIKALLIRAHTGPAEFTFVTGYVLGL